MEAKVHSVCGFGENKDRNKSITKSNQEEETSNQEVMKATMKCMLRSFKTSTREYYNNHEKCVHSTNIDITKVINCTTCEFQTLDHKFMKIYNRREHVKEKGFSCRICDF